MGWFRSAPMEYWSVAIPQNASHKVVAALGKLGSIQFVDVRDLTTTLRSTLCLILSRSDQLLLGYAVVRLCSLTKTSRPSKGDSSIRSNAATRWKEFLNFSKK